MAAGRMEEIVKDVRVWNSNYGIQEIRWKGEGRLDKREVHAVFMVERKARK